MDARTAHLKPDLLERIHELGLDGNRHADAITRSWRSLTEGAKTLVGVSGGADSLALLISLRRTTDQLVASYIRHDQRPVQETDVELQWVKQVAEALGIPFASGVANTSDGNVEASLRTARYEALELTARDHKCAFVATGHHADDQLETMLHALARGSGLTGLGGMPPRRELQEGLALVRPMLCTTHLGAVTICDSARVDWFEDPTNEHLDRSRAWIRARLVPSMHNINNMASLNAVRSAHMLSQATGVIDSLADKALGGTNVWDRDHLVSLPEIVLDTAMRRRILKATSNRHADKITHQRITELTGVIRDIKGHLRTFHFPEDIKIEVHKHRVEFHSATIAS
jgi:tRNA(Ile)-lysidine synthetase-like protein